MKLLKFPLGFPRLARVRAHKSFAQIIDNLWVMAKLRSVQSAWNALPLLFPHTYTPWSFALAKQCSMNRPSKLRVEIEIKQLATQCVGGGGGEAATAKGACGFGFEWVSNYSRLLQKIQIARWPLKCVHPCTFAFIHAVLAQWGRITEEGREATWQAAKTTAAFYLANAF